jgi:hypothetical protein
MSKMDWEETVSRIYKDIPAAEEVDWEGLFRDDPKILGDLVNDIIKVSVSQKGRPGKRSASSAAEVQNDLAKLMDTDYSDQPFPVALRIAMGERSVRQTSRLSGVDKMVIIRLLNGEGSLPTAPQMEALASALKKDPSYFIEYRAAYVCHAVYRMLCDNSESAVVFYRKLKNRRKGVR